MGIANCKSQISNRKWKSENGKIENCKSQPEIDDCEVTQGLTSGSEIWNLEFGICDFQFAILIFQWLNQYL